MKKTEKKQKAQPQKLFKWITGFIFFVFVQSLALTGQAANCSSDAWCWENSISSGKNLRDIWGTSDSDIFVVGVAGTILHYNGTSWSEMDSGTSNELLGVWGSGSNDVYAVGEGGIILHFDGTDWSLITVDSGYLFSVWGSSANDIYAAGLDTGNVGGRLWHYNGSTWRRVYPNGSTRMYDVWGSDADDVFVAGHDGSYHYNGSDWTLNSPLRVMYSVWGSSSSNVFTTGYYGTRIGHYDGTQWSNQQSGTTAELRGIWGSSDTDIFIVGNSGTIIHSSDSATWSSMTSGTTNTLWGVWGSSATNVYAVGNSGLILHYDGTDWSTVETNINSVWGSSESDIYAVGDAGTIKYSSDGSTWSALMSGTTSHLNNVWGSSGTDVFAVGDSGTILHSPNGSTWTTLTSGTANPLNGVWGNSSTDVFTVGDSGTILHSSNTNTWVPLTSGTTNPLNGVWGSSGTDVFTVGDSGTILHSSDTSTWIPLISGTTNPLNGVWGSSNTDVFAVGDSGTILHSSDGSTWIPLTSGTTTNLIAVWGSSSTEVYAMGATGTILYYNGIDWIQMESGTVNNLNGAWGSSVTNVYAVGNVGTILHRYVFTVTPSVGNGDGTISPSADQSVALNNTTVFTLTPGTSYYVESVTGTCSGTLSGNTFTTNPITADCTVIANFSNITHTVTSSVSGANGSINPLGPQNINEGATPSFNLSPDTGYHVDAVTGTCGGTLSNTTFTTDAITADCTVIASFTINEYTVTPSVLGGNGNISPSVVQTASHGTTISFSLFPATGYHIDTVTGTCSGTLAGTTFTTDPVTADCTVIANFTINEYAVTSSVAGANGSITPSGAQTANHGTTPSFSLSPATGYHVDAVTGTCGGTLSGTTFTANAITADCTVIASFVINEYTVTSSVSGANGSITPSGAQTAKHGATPSFSLSPATGYHVDAVDGTCGGTLSGTTFTANAITADCTVIASFVINEYTVTSSISGSNGSITPSGAQIANHGATLSFSLSPATGYHVDAVTGTCTGSLSGTTFTTDAIETDCTVVASFTDKYPLSIIFAGNGAGVVTSNPAGIDDCTTDCNADFTQGDSVTLTAVATDKKGGFLGWSGDGCTDTDDCTVLIDQAREITATFKNASPWTLFLPAILEAGRQQ